MLGVVDFAFFVRLNPMFDAFLPAMLGVISVALCAAHEKAVENVPPKLDRPGVVLTFDDAYITQWRAAQPIFKKHNAHATFFVMRFDRLKAKQLADLRELKAAGHAIGCHGLNHLKAVDTVKNSSVEEYLKVEIEPALALMRKAGFQPTSFAYPHCQHNEEIDTALSRYFRHLRGGARVDPGQTVARTEAIFTPINDVSTRLCLDGLGIDDAYGNTLDDIFAAMDRAAKRNEVVVFFAHNISDKGPLLHLSPTALEKILEHAVAAGLEFYTFDDLP